MAFAFPYPATSVSFHTVSTSSLFCSLPLPSVPSFPQLCPPSLDLAEQLDPQMCTSRCCCRESTSRKKRLCCPLGPLWPSSEVQSPEVCMTSLGCLAYCWDLVATHNCLLWFECETSPAGSHLNTWSSARSSRWKVVEPLRGGTLKEGVCHQRWGVIRGGP